ncbi:hypothetical protein [Luteimonas sp. SDU101]|uniref:hypothetical protein n=1 Tax=Luteimonas sp. SDU101 TaxID=3422593 RepID=UPI003EC08CC1
MTPNNPIDDFDFDDLPDLPLLEDEDSSAPDTTQEPFAVAQSEEGEGVDLTELMDLDLPEVSATPSIESAQPESDEAAPVAEPEPELGPDPAPAETAPSIEPEQVEGTQPAHEQIPEPVIAQDEQHADDVPQDVAHHVQAVCLAAEDETFPGVELAEFEPASQSEQTLVNEPAVEVPFVEEGRNPPQPDAAFVQDPEQAPTLPHNAARSRKPLIIGGAIAAVLAIGTAVFLLWPSAEPQAPVQTSVSAPSGPAADPSKPSPEPEPEREFTAADLVSDVLSDQPQGVPTPEAVVQPSAPVEPAPEVQAATPASAPTQAGPTQATEPAAVVAKPALGPSAAKPAKKPAPRKVEPAEEQETKWQDEALNALDAFEKGL